MHVHFVLHNTDCTIFLESLFHGTQPLVYQGFLKIEVSQTNSHTPHSKKLSRCVSSPTQVPLPDNTQQSQERDIHVPSGVRIFSPSKLRPQNHDLDRESTGIIIAINIIIIIRSRKIPQH